MRTHRFGLIVLAAMAFLTGCAGANDNFSPRSPVDEEQQVQSSASLEAYPPTAPADVAVGVDQTQYADTDPSALSEFKTTLEPYGTWEDTSTHGTVWVPSPSVVGPDFVPYSTAGRWTYDNTNWVWVSDYSWGWAPFHYGRWVLIPHRGWAWVPGRVYSPAWVTWSYGPSYVGWAPLGPSWYWYDGYAVGFYGGYTPYYVYCPHNRIFDHHVHTYVVHGPAAAPIAASTPPYVPARPSVDPVPGRVPASPTVNDARASASPTVAPTPRMLGQQDAQIVHPPQGGGLAKARQLATPDQAKLLGARAPAASGEFASGASIPRYAPAQSQAFTSTRPAEIGGASANAAAHGSGAGSARAWASEDARARVAPGVSNTPDPWRVQPPVAERSTFQPTSPSPASRFESRTLSSPAPSYVQPAPNMPRAETSAPMRAAPSFSTPSSPTPSYRAPSAPIVRPSSPSPSFSTPSYRAPSAPIVRPSSPSPSFSTPSYRAPSAPVMRPSSPPPSVRAPAAPMVRPSTPAPSPARAPARATIRR